MKSIFGVVIGQSNTFSSLLGITGARSEHSGVHSCKATNPVGFARTATYLEVDGNSAYYQSLEILFSEQKSCISRSVILRPP